MQAYIDYDSFAIIIGSPCVVGDRLPGKAGVTCANARCSVLVGRLDAFASRSTPAARRPRTCGGACLQLNPWRFMTRLYTVYRPCHQFGRIVNCSCLKFKSLSVYSPSGLQTSKIWRWELPQQIYLNTSKFSTDTIRKVTGLKFRFYPEEHMWNPAGEPWV